MTGERKEWGGNRMDGMLGVDNELKNMEGMKNMIIEDTELLIIYTYS